MRCIFVGFAVYMEEIDYCIFAELIQNFLSVNIRLSLSGPTVSCNYQHLCLRFPILDQRNPLFDKALLGAFPWLPDHQIHGWRTEKQLVRRSINPLTAKIPTIQRDFYVTIGIDDGYTLNLNSVSCEAVIFPFIPSQCTQQTTLAHLTLTN